MLRFESVTAVPLWSRMGSGVWLLIGFPFLQSIRPSMLSSTHYTLDWMNTWQARQRRPRPNREDNRPRSLHISTSSLARQSRLTGLGGTFSPVRFTGKYQELRRFLAAVEIAGWVHGQGCALNKGQSSSVPPLKSCNTVSFHPVEVRLSLKTTPMKWTERGFISKALPVCDPFLVIF
jgi:hypothetical protein